MKSVFIILNISLLTLLTYRYYNSLLRVIKALDQWLSTKNDWAPSPGDIWQYQETFFCCHNIRGVLMAAKGRGQECCQMSSSAQNSPHNKELSGPNVHSAKVGKHCPRQLIDVEKIFKMGAGEKVIFKACFQLTVF